MAKILLFEIQDDAALFGVDVFYNTDTFFVEIEKDGIPFNPPSYLATTSAIVGTYADYEFCDGLTRVQFKGDAVPPYARIERDANSLYCQPLSCDLLIQTLDITHESAFEKQDGKLVVNASTKYAPIRYSLDNVNFQRENVFYPLAPGDYTLYATDKRGCNTQAAFTINVATPPQAKWQYSFVDSFYDENHLVIIKQKGYAGAVEEVRGTATPMYVDKRTRGDERMKIIKGSEYQINLICTRQYQFAEIFDSDERKHLVEYYINDVLVHKGWVMPEIWQEAYQHPPYVVGFSATDGLGTLKEFEFETLLGEQITGIKSQLEVIVLCLKHLQLDLPITTAIHTYETRMAFGDMDDPLTQAFVDTSRYKGMNCEEVIEHILKPYRGYIYQEDGEWIISQKDLPGRAIARPILYQSEFRGEYFRRNNCEFGLGVEEIFYSVPAGAFVSEISVADANAKRDAVFAQNGQAYANERGTCPTEPPAETGKLYIINSTPYNIQVENNGVISYEIPAAIDNTPVVPRLVEDASGPLLFPRFRVRKYGGMGFLPDERLRVQVMRASTGGTPNGQIPSSDGQGISPLSIFQDFYESNSLEDPSNSYAPSFNNYQAGQNYVVILDLMPEIVPLHFVLELYVGGQLASDSNRLSYNGSVTARIKRMENRHVETSFKLEVRPIGPTIGLDASPMSTEVAYGNEDYVEVSFHNIGWTSASFNPAISINISKVVADDPNVKLDSSSKAIWINI